MMTSSMLPILRYIPKSYRKDNESPFTKCTIPKITTKAVIKIKKVNWPILKENGVLSVH